MSFQNVELSEDEKQLLALQQQANEQQTAFTPMQGMMMQGDMKEVIREYTKNEDAPTKIQELMWGLVGKDVVLGFNDPNTALEYMDNFEKAKLWDIMKDTPQEFTWEKGQNYIQLENNLRSRINRSILRPNGGINERIAENMQIQQQISTSMNTGGTGFFNNLKSQMGKILK